MPIARLAAVVLTALLLPDAAAAGLASIQSPRRAGGRVSRSGGSVAGPLRPRGRALAGPGRSSSAPLGRRPLERVACRGPRGGGSADRGSPRRGWPAGRSAARGGSARRPSAGTGYAGGSRAFRTSEVRAPSRGPCATARRRPAAGVVRGRAGARTSRSGGPSRPTHPAAVRGRPPHSRLERYTPSQGPPSCAGSSSTT